LLKKSLIICVSLWVALLGLPFQHVTTEAFAQEPAGGAKGHTSDERGASEFAGEHCITGPGTPTECFKSEAEALYAASKGRIQLPPGEKAHSLPAEEVFDSLTGVQAILYEHADHGGSTLTIYSNSCSGWNNMATGWNDRVSSVWLGVCGITLYEHYNLAGPWLDVSSPGTSYVGSTMNDKSSSWALR
jgi:hypothetical protein